MPGHDVVSILPRLIDEAGLNLCEERVVAVRDTPDFASMNSVCNFIADDSAKTSRIVTACSAIHNVDGNSRKPLLSESLAKQWLEHIQSQTDQPLASLPIKLFVAVKPLA